jgi:Ca2+-binding EF-hand superfamily protein
MAYFVDKAVEILKDGLETGDCRKAINKALKVIDTEDMIHITWCVDDVIERARMLKVRVSKKKAREILKELERNHDATLGITWDTIDSYFDNM